MMVTQWSGWNIWYLVIIHICESIVKQIDNTITSLILKQETDFANMNRNSSLHEQNR